MKKEINNTVPSGKNSIDSFALKAALMLFVFTTLVFVFIAMYATQNSYDIVLDQASSYIDLIVDARSWNSNHGSVWVPKTSTDKSNPYLLDLGINPDTKTVDGQTLTLRNPAIMTKEIASIAKLRHAVVIRLISTNPLNPENSPDFWENKIFKKYPSSSSQKSAMLKDDSRHILRVMRPLKVEPSCLECHASQGYKVGDIRGAISIKIPLKATDEQIWKQILWLILIYVLVLVFGGSIGYMFLRTTRRRLYEDEKKLEVLATTDVLTGIANRHMVLEALERELARAKREKRQLGLLELDIDFFKKVNDTLGHPAGDEVLKEATTRVSTCLREYDVFGRIGGEEFLIVAPAIDETELQSLAERVRCCIDVPDFTIGGGQLHVTISLGTTLSLADDTVDSIIARVDEGLYRAKETGRNRVCSN